MTRVLRVVAPAVLLLAALAALLAALAYGGGAQAPLLSDPGAVVRWGLPVVTVLVNLGAAVALGGLVLCCFVLSPRRREYGRALDVAAAGAAVFTVASAADGILQFLSVGDVPVSSPRFGPALGDFIANVALGQAWLATTLMAAAVTVLCLAVRSHPLLLGVTALTVAALLPIAAQGHAAGSSGHDAAVTGLALHLVFVGVWLGGLLVLVLLRHGLGAARAIPLVERYSSLALLCFVVVALSGYLSAELRLGTLAALLTPYGVLVLVKAASLVVLGLFGLAYRRVVIDGMRAGRRRLFWGLVVAELAFMGVASGVAVALSRTATPVAETPATATPAQILTDEPLPPPLTASAWVTRWDVDLFWLLACALGLFFYLAGVWRLRRRGERWPVSRTLSWVLGVLVLFVVTCGVPAAYEKYLFSQHMLGHMLVGMLVPMLLVPSAPVALLRRAARRRTDGSRGPREWILALGRSRLLRPLAHPLVAGGLFLASPWVFVFSPALRFSVANHGGHEAMTIWFLAVGCLFMRGVGGLRAGDVAVPVAPVPWHRGRGVRVGLVLAAIVSAIGLGLAIAFGDGLLLADWYGAMGRTWGLAPLADQRLGALLGAAVDVAPMLVLLALAGLRPARRAALASPDGPEARPVIPAERG